MVVIPANKNVGASLNDINANFAELGQKSSDKTFACGYLTPTKTWIIAHNLGKFPSVTVVDDEGDVVGCEIEYTDANTLTLRFSEATVGMAYLN